MTDSDESGGTSSGRRTKVARLLDEYDLETLGAELERRWTADGDDRMSLRDLADHFNAQLLASSMADAGLQPLPGEVDNVYELLTDDDVSTADRTRTRRRLERDGVDVEALLGDFVTYQAVRTYLKRDRGAEHTTDDRDRTVVETENIQRLRGRTVTVTEEKLKQLERGDHLVLGDARVLVDISVLCEDCGSQYEIDELLQRGGCDCTDATE